MECRSLPRSLPSVVRLDHVERLGELHVDVIAVIGSLSIEEVGEKPQINAGTCLNDSAPEDQAGSGVIKRRGCVAHFNFCI